MTILETKDSKNINEMMSQLGEFVSLLTDEQREELRLNLGIEHFKKNDIIYHEGEVPQYLHCLVSGKVKLFKDGVGGRSQIMRVMGPVSYFGYRAYLANQNFVNAAGAFENCCICMIPIELVEKWMMANNALAMFFVRLLAAELGASDERTVNLTQKHIRGRLAEALLFLVDSYGMEEDGQTINIYLSREDLASLSNMTTSNAIRTLSAFANENIIGINGRRIRVFDIEAIKKISKIG